MTIVFHRHAPGYIRDAFVEAIDAFAAWNVGEPEPTVDVEDSPVRISRVCEMLWRCDDIVPSGEFGILADHLPEGIKRLPTYASCARAMRREIIRMTQ